jgi:membrane-associated PAP2 superfamily phosphatase
MGWGDCWPWGSAAGVVLWCFFFLACGELLVLSLTIFLACGELMVCLGALEQLSSPAAS